MIIQLLWCDEFIKKYFSKLGFEIIIIYKLLDIDYNYITILGTPLEKVKRHKNMYFFYLDIYPYITVQKCDRLMLFLPTVQFEGIILGNSHARHGYLPYCFNEKWINFALSAQDVSHNIQTVYYVIKKYPQQFTKLKYIIFDLFDYSYFNYELKYSSNHSNYYDWGGFKQEGEIDRSQSLKRLPRWLVNKEKEYAEVNYKLPEERNVVCKKRGDSYITILESKIMKEYFEKSWIKNSNLLVEFVEKMNDLNVYIYFTLIPRIQECELKENSLEFVEKRRQEFFKVFDEIKTKNYRMVNLKDTLNLEDSLFYDYAHLNYKGAFELTQIMNGLIYDE